MPQDQDKTRAFQLGFKKRTEGLTTEEEQELQQLNRKIQIQQALLSPQDPSNQGG